MKDFMRRTDDEYCEKAGRRAKKQSRTHPPDGYLSVAQLAERFNSRTRNAVRNILVREKCACVMIERVKFYEAEQAVSILRQPRRRVTK